MKWIKRYNEAIGPKLTKKVYDEETGVTQSVPSTGFSPAKFRTAGHLATSANQTKKAGILRDYADEKEFGYYNVTALQNRTTRIENIKVTDLRISNVRYGVVMSGQDSQTLANFSPEDIISKWENGNAKLGLTFDVSFRLLNSSKTKLSQLSTDYFRPLSKTYNWIPFSISLVLSKNNGGIDDLMRCGDCDGEGEFYCYECDGHGEDYNGGECQQCDGHKGARKCESCNGSGVAGYIWNGNEKIKIEKDSNGKPIYDVQSFFEDTKKFSLEMSPKEITSSDSYTLVFSDKRSAIEFTKDLPKIVAKSDEFKKKLIELLSILSHEPSEDLEESMKVFHRISNNKLLPEDPKGNQTFYNSYFYKKIAEI